MTIFLKILRPFIEETLQDITVTSLQKDKGLSNKVAGFFSLGVCGRDPKLAASKRKIVQDLSCKIKRIFDAASEDKLTDKEVYKQLHIAVDNAIMDGAGESSRQHAGSGNSVAKLRKISVFLRSFVITLERSSLLDLPADSDPLNILSYYATLYYGNKIWDKVKDKWWGEKLLDKLLNKWIDREVLSTQKDGILAGCIRSCRKELEELALERQNNSEDRKQIVLKQLYILMATNQQLCNESGNDLKLQIAVAVVLTLDSSIMHPGVGNLFNCIKTVSKKLGVDDLYAYQVGLLLEKESSTTQEERLLHFV